MVEIGKKISISTDLTGNVRDSETLEREHGWGGSEKAQWYEQLPPQQQSQLNPQMGLYIHTNFN